MLGLTRQFIPEAGDLDGQIPDGVMDQLLELLSTMHLSGAVFLEADFSAPWCITAQVSPGDCAPATAIPRQIIAYHYVTAGQMLLKVQDAPPVSVVAGEMVVLPRNNAHIMGSNLKMRAVSADVLIKPAMAAGLPRIEYGGGGEITQILCGFLGNDMPGNPVLAMLPSVLTLPVRENVADDWLENSFKFAVQQLIAGSSKSTAMLAKLAELLFMEAVRRYLGTQAHDSQAWTAGLHDPVIARALGLLHSQLPRRWTTEDLARAVALSRSAFADRFTRLVGKPPMRYLAQQRLERAAVLLDQHSEPIAKIAYEVGYESEAAFSRAFKRERGISPAIWRHRNH